MRLTREGSTQAGASAPSPAPAPAGPIGALALAALLGALLALAGLGGCTTAREREDPRSIVGALRFRSAETARHFLHNYRSGNLYQDFRPVMIADAIFQDERYRGLLVDTLRQRYLLGEKDAIEMLREQQEQFDTHFEFLVFLYGGSNVPVRMNTPDANWKLLLRDDEGDLLAPVSMHGIRVDSATYRYIQGYFSGLDRWSQVYLVQFPKLEKILIGKAIGARPFELLVTGLEGTITMRWEDPSMFYRSREGLRLPGPPEGSPEPTGTMQQASAPAEEIPSRR